MFTTLFVFLSTSFAILWSSVFLIVAIFGLRLQKVGGNKLRAFSSKVKIASVWTEEDAPDQWILGKWFIGYIYTQPSGQHSGEQKTLYLFTSYKWYKQAIHGLTQSQENETPKNITLYDRVGPFWYFTWDQMSVKPPSWTPYPSQIEAINKILQEFKERGSATCLLSGPPGSGKSNIPLLLARELLLTKKQVSFVDTFNPTDPNDSFSGMYTRINPDIDNPLIVVLEEIDGIILAMHEKVIIRHEHLHIQVTCKADWNKWLDRFDRGYYMNVILLMTSNKPLSWFNQLDESYFRDGRVNLKLHI